MWSVAVIVKANVPATVGVALTTPLLRLSPVGKELVVTLRL